MSIPDAIERKSRAYTVQCIGQFATDVIVPTEARASELEDNGR